MPPFAHTAAHRRLGRRLTRGLSLIELIVFIVVLSAALAGVLQVFTQATTGSADPAVRRQALAIAQSLLEEAQLMPFTYCDGDDANVAIATSSAGCAGAADAIGAEAGEGRYATPQFDHVNDLDGYAMAAGIVDITNTPVAGLAAYSASVRVAAAALGDITAASGEALRITVTVSGPGGVSLSVAGYRSRHAPNTTL